MFEDYIQSGENWLTSTLLLSLTRSSSQRRKGRHVLTPYWEVKKKFGNAVGAQILQDKKAMEAKKPAGDSIIYYMKHPEAPDAEESCCVLNPKSSKLQTPLIETLGSRKNHNISNIWGWFGVKVFFGYGTSVLGNIIIRYIYILELNFN